MRNLLCACFVSLCFIGCDDNDNEKKEDLSQAALEKAKSLAVSAQWRITQYTESEIDHTADFSGYIFGFESDGMLTATNGSSNHPGLWSVTAEDNDDDNGANEFNDVDFNIAFTAPPEFEELTEDWEIISMSATEIKLQHESGGDNEVDFLTFEKI